MKITIPIHCPRCRRQVLISNDLNDTHIAATCACGYDLSGSLDLRVTIGKRLLFRAKQEYAERKDIPLSMVLSAMAFECELSRLLCKYEGIAAIDRGTLLPEKEIDDLLMNFRSVRKKIEHACRLMHPAGLEDFVTRDAIMVANLSENGVKTGTLVKDFERILFWPRNMILHRGVTSYKEEDASRSYIVALLGISMLEELDNLKRASMNSPPPPSPP